MPDISARVQEIRRDWKISDEKRDAGLTTPKDVMRYDNLSYGPCGKWNLLDIYCPKEAEEALPCIINIHGGAWVYGTKEVYQYYCMSLARRGFAVVNLNYRLAPENPYPAALEDINSAMRFVLDAGDEYHMDTENLFVTGDSAGAQLASQYLAMCTDSAYGEMFDFEIPQVRIRAAALNCGMYDTRRCLEFGLHEPFVEYVGKNYEKKTYNGRPLLDTLDVLAHITKAYPPCFVMSSCHDFLLENAEPMYQYLKKQGVEAVLKIYGSPGQKEIAHVFHVNMRLKEAKECNDEECRFFSQYISR